MIRFGFDSFEEFKEEADYSMDLNYRNKAGELYAFHLEQGGIGYELFDYNNKIDYEYKTLEDMINNHIMPDGVPFKDVYEGENYFSWKWLDEEYMKNNKEDGK